MSVQRYPLAWPAGWRRAQLGGRRSGQFKVDFEKAVRTAQMAEINAARDEALRQRQAS